MHRLGILPFLWLTGGDVWREHAQVFRDAVGIERLYAYMPDISLWDKPFEEWTDADWGMGLSALWRVDTGEVLWADGAPNVQDMPHVGQPIGAFNEWR
ncbi:hypothetical protein FJZ36_19205 [Candidatus Poribacteria bacterium]|nr:hypothetical protein [Candidatus Poribacteria bacterium]